MYKRGVIYSSFVCDDISASITAKDLMGLTILGYPSSDYGRLVLATTDVHHSVPVLSSLTFVDRQVLVLLKRSTTCRTRAVNHTNSK